VNRFKTVLKCSTVNGSFRKVSIETWLYNLSGIEFKLTSERGLRLESLISDVSYLGELSPVSCPPENSATLFSSFS